MYGSQYLQTLSDPLRAVASIVLHKLGAWVSACANTAAALDRSHFKVFTRTSSPPFSIVMRVCGVQPAKREEVQGPRSFRMRSDTLCVVINCFYTVLLLNVRRSAPHNIMCKTTTASEMTSAPDSDSRCLIDQLIALSPIAGANSPRSVTATLHNRPFRAWERSISISPC